MSDIKNIKDLLAEELKWFPTLADDRIFKAATSLLNTLESQRSEIDKITADRDRLSAGITKLKKHLASEGDFHAWHIVTLTIEELQKGQK